MSEYKLNPFEDDDDEYLVDADAATVDREQASERQKHRVTKAATDVELPGLDVVANRLLDDHLFLTALELHMELLESGRELGRLRDFFSNPANFERLSAVRTPGTMGESSPRLTRAPSVQTFDSIDFARYSDDGERQENDRVAVLEFELRNAQDTIRLLRTALTKAAAAEITPEAPSSATTPTLMTINEPAQPYERRALNFLVHEYLLHQDYKLTSVTFSEENTSQDFDDWDDVGINVAKPPDLLHMYREFGHYRSSSGAQLCDSSSCTDGELVLSAPAVEDLQQTMEMRIATLEKEIHLLESENVRLTRTIEQLEQNNNQHPLGSTPSISPIKSTTYWEPAQEISSGLISVDNKLLVSGSSQSLAVPDDLSDNPPDENYVSAVEEVSKSSQTAAGVDEKEAAVPVVESAISSPSTVLPDVDNSWILEAVHSPHCNTSLSFQQLLLSRVFHVLPDNRIYGEVSHIAELNEDAVGEIVPLLARCLPYIVPKVLLAAREELIPLIVSAAALHADSVTRDNLLNLLFNLIKRPEVEHRQMILLGCVAFARHAGAARVESELLPQCWEQIAHRHVERRLLVAEACGALAPHIPPALRGSLLLSMLQQMMDDSVEDVREAATRSLGIVVGFVDDDDKYQSTEALLFSALSDSSEHVLEAVKQIFLPSLATWAMNLGRLESSLLSSFLERIEKVVDPSQTGSGAAATGIRLTDPHRFTMLISSLCDLLSVLLSSFLVSAPFASASGNDGDGTSTCNSITWSLPKPSTELLDAVLLLGSKERLQDLLCRYEEYISAEWYHPWLSHVWVADELVARLVLICEQLDACEQTIVHMLVMFICSLCRTFGPSFTQTTIRPRFCRRLQFPEPNVSEMSHLEHVSLVRCSAPVYAAGVLGAFSTEDDRSTLTKFISDFIQAAALHRCGLVGIMATVTELCLVQEASATLPELLLSVLWECVVHSSIVIRVAAARIFEPIVRSGGVPESMIGTQVVPALVTLAGDSNSDVRAATVGAFGATVECVSDRTILDKIYMQLQSLMDDSAYRDEHALRVALIRAIGHAGPAAEPHFRDDFILPRLTALAVQNSTSGSGEVTSRRTDIALALFDAYNSVSCCFVRNQLVSEVLLPGLRCLHRDLVNLVPDHATVIASMIREFEDRIDSAGGVPGRPASSTNGNMTPSSAPASAPSPSSEGIRLKMMGHIKDVKDRASHSNINLSKMFNSAKK